MAREDAAVRHSLWADAFGAELVDFGDGQNLGKRPAGLGAGDNTRWIIAANGIGAQKAVGTGGNAGAQAATAAVRALALGEVRSGDVLRVAWRECRVGLLLGVMLAAVGLVIGTLLVDLPVAATVALSIVVICSWAAVVGSTMPLLARRVGIDPAVVSAPLVTTLVDATGLIIYFLVAHAVLGV